MPAAAVYNFADAADPTKEMLRTIGDLSTINIAGGRVLIWSYIPPRKSKGGILMPDSEVKENVWQSAVGYVLKAGPLAFKDDPAQNINFGGFAAAPGDWVTLTPGEGKRIQINGVDCRLIEDALIQMKIADPSTITHRQ
jgi:hypothetical protein